MVFGCHVILQDHAIERSCGFVEERFKISHHPAKFGCKKHSCNKDIQVLVCHVILQDHIIKTLYDFMVRRLSRFVTNLPEVPW